MDKLPSGMKLRQLQYFLAVADSLHFSKAAELLSATQPTLSHQIAQMEAHLGVQLFDRIGKKVRLTESGAILRDYAVRALKELEAGCIALGELEGLERGTLRIGIIQSFSRTLLPPILGTFISRYPTVTVSVEEMTANAIEQALSKGTIDLGIAFASLRLADTEEETILQERLHLVVGAGHPFAGRCEVRIVELDRQPLALLGRDYSTRQLIDDYLKGVGATPRVVCETNSIEVLLGAVAHSQIATIIPECALRPGEDLALRSLPLVEPEPVRSSALLWPRHSFRTAAARTFGALMRERFLEHR